MAQRKLLKPKPAPAAAKAALRNALTKTRALARRLPIKRKHIVIALAAWVALTAISLAYGTVSALEGKNELLNAKSTLQDNAQDTTRAEKHFATATTKLDHANKAYNNPLTWPLRAIPGINTQIRSATALTHVGEKTSRGIRTTIREASKTAPELADKAATKQNGTTSISRAATLQKLTITLSKAERDLAITDLGPAKGLIPPLKKAHDLAVEQLVPLDENITRATSITRALSELFNNNKTYALFGANPSEARAGTGMLLSTGLLHSGNGTFQLDDMQSSANIIAPTGSITWPKDMEERWGFSEQKNSPNDLMMSPRFDQSAPLAAQMWKTTKGVDVDGVIVVDPTFLQLMLKATGPCTVDGITYTADNVMQQLLWDQYVRLTGNAELNAQRKDMQAELAKQIFQRLSSNEWNPITLARELANAADGRHFLAWSKDPAMNENWQIAGVSGETTEDSMMLSVINLGGNKLDQFLEINANVESKKLDDSFDMSATVTVKNTAPATGPQYVMGPFPGSQFIAGEYYGALALTLPGSATGVQVDNDADLVASGPDGNTFVIATPVDLKSGETKTLTFRWYLPDNAEVIVVEPSARAKPVTWHYSGEKWTDAKREYLQPN